MRTALCELRDRLPDLRLHPSEHVAAAVSKAGGLGVLGCVRFNDAEELDTRPDWMDDNTDGKPYGVDVVMPMKVPTEGTAVDLDELIPEEHPEFVDETLPSSAYRRCRRGGPRGRARLAALGRRSHVDVALKHRPVLIANALGSPPIDVIEKATSTASRSPRSPAAPSTRCRTSTTASTSSSPRATRPAATPVRSPRWC